MAASPVKAGREGNPPSPETSLTWCLAHLSKPGAPAEHHGHGKADTGGCGGRELDRRSRVCQWRALVAVRTQHIKGDKAGIARFRAQGGLRPLLDLLRHPDCSRKTLDLALSILANCCTELETRVEVRNLDGVNVLVEVLKRNVALETVQNRAARALANLAMDSEGSALIHSSGCVPLLLLCVSLSSGPSSPTAAPAKEACPKLECAQSAARALLYLSDTPSNRLSLLTQGTLYALAPLIAPEYPQALRRAALRTLHELTRGCGIECAREVSRSAVLAQLGIMASGESGKPFEELALKTLANMCTQGCLRPLVGSLGVIQKFIEEVKKDPLKSGVFFKALCLCCKEAINRAKVKESGGLEVLIGFLAAYQSHPLSRLAILACVDFVFDESAMEQLQELGLAPLLVARLVELTRGEEPSPEKMDVSLASSVSAAELLTPSCFESFDLPPPPGDGRREEAGREQGLCSNSFLSLRSWLVSEGLISSEGELLASSGVEGEWGSLQIPPSPSSQASSPNQDSFSVMKNCSQTNLSASSACKKAAHSSPVTPQTQASPSKFSSPHRRRHRAHSVIGLSDVTLDAPPSVPRSTAFHHPYHPEPWTPESPILLLLSRFSHATDPSAALVTPGVMSGLLFYLTQHQDPSSRCLRMLCRLSCNSNCLQALVQSGLVGLIHHYLCQREGGLGGEERQTDHVKAKVKQLGVSLLDNLRVQCESGFGAGVLAHVMLSGSDADKMNCALSLPLISSNKSLLKKLLLDSGGLLIALQPLGSDDDDDDDMDQVRPAEGGRLPPRWLNSPLSGRTPQLHSLYFSLLAGCLSRLVGGIKGEFDKKRLHPSAAAAAAAAASLSKVHRVSPPPSKKPRLADVCPYGVSTFDLLLLLDDGTRVPANREAVAGLEGSPGATSEYFRGLLRGGFQEAQGRAEEAIRIKDVSTGVLLPVLHYLHGCRLTEEGETGAADGGERRGRCQTLDMLLLESLGVFQKEREDGSAEKVAFQDTALGQMMVGACRFLVSELQRELDDLCVSLLMSGSASRPPPAAPEQSAEEHLANRTSELELTGAELRTENLHGQKKKQSSFTPASARNKTVHKERGGAKGVAPPPKSTDRSAVPEESGLRPKTTLLRAGARDPPSSAGASGGGGGGALAALLPQVYWFSQRYNYPAVGRACLSLLLGRGDCPRPFSSSSLAGACLRRLARAADCTETLKQDLICLITAALS